MINLLPPAIKEEVTYSRYNRTVLHYLALVFAVAIVTAAAFIGAILLVNHRTATAESALAVKNQQIASYSATESKAKQLNARLASIAGIQKSQAKFSELLADLAQYMPQGTAITSISLTGDYKKPVRLTVVATDYKTALGFRDSIARSPRISAADIESISNNSEGPGTKVVVTFAFAPQGAK